MCPQEYYLHKFLIVTCQSSNRAKKAKKNIQTILQPHLVHNWEYFIIDKYKAGIISGQGFSKHNPGYYGMHPEAVQH